MSVMTKEEKETLVNSVADAAMRDLLQREDMVEILRICRSACERRIEVIEEQTKPKGPVQ